MSKNIRAEVMALLNNYRDNQRKIELLRFELEHPSHVSANDMISSMTFVHGEVPGKVCGHISDKTMYVALNYQEKADEANSGVIDEITAQLCELELQQTRLEHYINLLDKREEEAIRLTYIEKQSNEVITKKLCVSERTLRYIRSRAIDALCEMYSYTESLRQ